MGKGFGRIAEILNGLVIHSQDSLPLPPRGLLQFLDKHTVYLPSLIPPTNKNSLVTLSYIDFGLIE